MRVAIFLRAINTGDRRVTNAELIECLGGADLTEVSAFQAAGNLLATAFDGEDVASIVARVESSISETFGFESEAFVRTAAQLTETVDSVPFSDVQIEATEGRVQVTFLRERSTVATKSSVGELVPDDDLVHVGDDVWYWLPRTKISESTLKVGAIERILGPMTMRTLATVEKVLARL
ncbi:MAG: DUF1697 domain-containing protein [Actinomycetota bacterium]